MICTSGVGEIFIYSTWFQTAKVWKLQRFKKISSTQTVPDSCHFKNGRKVLDSFKPGKQIIWFSEGEEQQTERPIL